MLEHRCLNKNGEWSKFDHSSYMECGCIIFSCIGKGKCVTIIADRPKNGCTYTPDHKDVLASKVVINNG